MNPWFKQFYSGHVLQTVSFFSFIHCNIFICRYVTCCAFSLDNKLLATGSNDKLVKIWKITADGTSKGKEKKQTRLHSSRMRTPRVLTVSPSMFCAGGVSAPGGCTCSQGGVCSGGCTWSRGCLLPGGVLGPEGVSAPGVVCSGGCLLLGGCLFQGVSALGGVCSGGCTWSRGVSAPRGVYLVWGGVCSWGVYLVWEGVCSRGGVSGKPPL